MPGYIEKILLQHAHKTPARPQHSPYKPPPKKYGEASQDPVPEDMTNKIDEKHLKRVQQVIGGVLYYAHVVDCTVLTVLSSVSSE